MTDLARDLRDYLRVAAAEFLLEQVQAVVDDIVAGGEGYIPEVEMGGARDFGEGPIIKNAEVNVDGILAALVGTYDDVAAWVKAVEGQDYQTDTDPGDAQDVAGARDDQRCARRCRFARHQCRYPDHACGMCRD